MLVHKLLARVMESNSLDEAKAYADAAIMAMEETGKATISVQRCQEGKLINVIKEVRNEFGWGLKESKDFLDGCPRRIENLERSEANRIAKRLEEAGAVVQVL